MQLHTARTPPPPRNIVNYFFTFSSEILHCREVKKKVMGTKRGQLVKKLTFSFSPTTELYSYYIGVFTLLKRARPPPPLFKCWLKERRALSFRARRQVLVYAMWVDEEPGPAKCQAILVLLKAGLCLAHVPVPLQLGLYPSVSSFLLGLRCTCHLVWLHICGYPCTKPGQQLPLCSQSLRSEAPAVA